MQGDPSDAAARIARAAAGFRHVVARAYDDLDMTRVHRAAGEGFRDLRALPARVAEVI